MTQALAPLTDKQIKTRIELNRSNRFGLESANPDQLNVIFNLAKRWQLDPVTDITLYQGQPFIKIEGHFRLLRRHPEYRGFHQRPLNNEDKSAWGYDDRDIVIETTIHTAAWGDIIQRGVVFADEIEAAQTQAKQSGKRGAPLATHYVAIAEKRSLARAGRAAFGQDVPSAEEMDREIEIEMQQRADPERTKRLAARHDELMNEEYFEIPALTEPQPETAEEPAAVDG